MLVPLVPTITNITKAALNGFTPLDRDCYKDNDFNLQYMEWKYGMKYSMSNCLYNAVVENILSHCQCIPEFVNFVQKEGMSFCYGEHLLCQKNWMHQLGSYEVANLTSSLGKDGIRRKCLAACEDQHYTLTQSHAPYTNKRTFQRKIEFCYITKKILKVCNDETKKSTFEAYYDEVITCQRIQWVYKGNT